MEKLHLEAVQWSTMPHIDEIEPISDEDYEVLKELGSVLKKHGREEKFGVCLLHKHFDLKDGERMVEITDDENRTLVSRITKSEEKLTADVIETQWRFPKGIQAVTVCEKVCDYFLGHKRRHQKVGR
ncbi:MAG: hypothetical protein ACRBB4_15795 [Neptuniibacter sp.]